MKLTIQPGDTVAIVATARKVKKDDLAPAIYFLESNGFEVVLGPNLFAVDNQFAGTDAERAESLQWAIDHPKVKMIWCARGGYGTMRLLPLINWASFYANPKILAGFSDVTAIHHVLNNRHIPSLHSTMPLSWPTNTPATHASVLKAMLGTNQSYAVQKHELNRFGDAKATVVGGNLSLVYAMLGTKDALHMKGKILFIEDLDEYLYHIDRMMMALKLGGHLADLAGLIVGGMSDMRDNEVPFGRDAVTIIADAVKEYNYPVCFDFPTGHESENLALWLGTEYELSVTKGGGCLVRI